MNRRARSLASSGRFSGVDAAGDWDMFVIGCGPVWRDSKTSAVPGFSFQAFAAAVVAITLSSRGQGKPWVKIRLTSACGIRQP